jgi:hypothetical protein
MIAIQNLASANIIRMLQQPRARFARTRGLPSKRRVSIAPRRVSRKAAEYRPKMACRIIPMQNFGSAKIIGLLHAIGGARELVIEGSPGVGAH